MQVLERLGAQPHVAPRLIEPYGGRTRVTQQRLLELVVDRDLLIVHRVHADRVEHGQVAGRVVAVRIGVVLEGGCGAEAEVQVLERVGAHRPEDPGGEVRTEAAHEQRVGAPVATHACDLRHGVDLEALLVVAVVEGD